MKFFINYLRQYSVYESSDMKHSFHLFSLTTEHFVKEDTLHWIWISTDGYIGYSVDSYSRNIEQWRFVRPEWSDNINKTVEHLWSSPRFQEQILYTIYECNESVPQLLHFTIEYDDSSHLFRITERDIKSVYNESIYDCLEDMNRLKQLCQYLETYFSLTDA